MMAEQTDVLAKPLPKPVAPTGKGRVGFKEAIGISEPFMTRKAEIQPEIAKAEADIAKGEQEQKEIKATGELSAQKRFGQEQETAMQGYQEKLEQEPLPAFIPSKDTAQDIAGLFSVISVISMLVGGGGKMSGQLALGNMNGMMEGYRKGRDDLYKKERTEFDKNFNAMMKKHAEFRQEMEDAVKLAATNKEEGFRAAEMAAIKAGSSVILAKLRKGELMGSYNLVNESQKGAEHALGMEAKLRADEAAAAQRERLAKTARDAADTRARLAREQQVKLAEIKASSPKALKKGEFQANYIGDIIGRPVDPDAAAKAAAGTMYKMSLKELQELNMKLGGAPGLKVSFVDYMNKYLATKAGADGKFDLTDLQAAYDNLEKNDKSFRAMSDNSKLLAKKELDSVMSYLQVKYGNRAPVAEFRAAQTVLNRSNMTPTAYNNVVEAQIKDTDNRLGAAGFKPKDILALNKHFAQNRSDLDLLSGVEDETEDSDLYVSPYEFSTVAEAEAFLDSVGIPKMKAKVGGQEGIVTPRGQ
jgi:hypothetical protein